MTQKTFTNNGAGDLISDAIMLLREHEPPEGYHLAFSGGKDSIVIYDLAKRAGVKFTGNFSKTTVDPPEVLKFIKENYPEVVWAIPKKSMFQIIVDHGTPRPVSVGFAVVILKRSGAVVEQSFLASGLLKVQEERNESHTRSQESIREHFL